MTDTMMILLAGLGAYLIASIPFGLVITRLMGLGDLRQIGSGNIGATNVLRTGNKLAAFLTLVMDSGKGAMAVLVAASLTQMPLAIAAAAVMSVVGHCFSVWLGFRGGKGVATGIGVVLAMAPLAGLTMILTWLVVAGITRISSLSALIAYAVCPVALMLLATADAGNAFGAAGVVIALVSWWQHRSNIGRILAGREPKIGR